MNTKALVALFVTLAVAAGLYLWTVGGHGDPAPAGAGAPGGEAAAAAKGQAEPASATLAPGEAPAVAPLAAERTAAPEATLGKAGETVMVRGRVVDAQGAPRAGVVFELRTWAAGEGLDLVGPLPRDRERSRDRADLANWTTAADGTFRIPLAKAHDGTLELLSDDLVFRGNQPGVSGQRGDQDLGDLVVLRGGRVAGLVQDQRGQPVAGVKVAATQGSLGLGTQGATTTAADGTFALGMLRPGKWALRTASGKFLPAVAEIELAPEEQRTGLVLVVEPGNAIAGQVVDDRGAGVAGMKVGSKRREARAGVDIERFSSDEAAVTDANGYFTLSGLADEVATVRAFGPGHSVAVAADVAVGTGNLVLRVDRLGVVEGVLAGADGTPIAGSRIRAQSGGSAGGGLVLDDLDVLVPGGRAEVTTAADGSFRLESVRPGNVTIVASGAAHRPVRQEGVSVLPAQTTKGVRLVADLGAVARLQVVDQLGKPVAGAQVRARREEEPLPAGGGQFRARRVTVEDRDGDVRIGGGPAELGSAVTDDQGRAAIAGLPAGELSVVASHGEFAAAVPLRLVMPKAGAVEGTLTLRKPGAAEILVRGTDGAPQAGVELRVQPLDAGSGSEPRTVTSGEGGVVRVASLAPGNYTVELTRARATGRFGDAAVFVGGDDATIPSSRQQFTVVAGETAAVEVRRPLLARVHGVVTGADGPAAGVQVELRRDGEPALDLPGLGGPGATTGADGTFAFDDVEAGSYVLRYGKRDQVVKARQPLEVPANTPELRQDLALRTGKVRIQVAAAGTGDPVAKAEVELVRADASPVAAGAPPQRQERRVMMVTATLANDGPDGSEMTTMTMGAQRAFTDEDGIAEIDDVPVGDYTLRIKHRKHAPYELKGKTVVDRQLTDCGRVELAAAGFVRGKVLDAAGKQVRMALVASRALDSEAWSEPQMAQGGLYRLQGLAAGKYTVRAWRLGDAAPVYSPEVEVEVRAGEAATADLQLPGN